MSWLIEVVRAGGSVQLVASEDELWAALRESTPFVILPGVS